jgi:hypothetical protein
MDEINLFLKKVGYKFPKGFCDINDKQDISLLQSLLEQHGVPMYEVILVNEAASDIKNELIDAGYAPELINGILPIFGWLIQVKWKFNGLIH